VVSGTINLPVVVAANGLIAGIETLNFGLALGYCAVSSATENALTIADEALQITLPSDVPLAERPGRLLRLPVVPLLNHQGLGATGLDVDAQVNEFEFFEGWAQLNEARLAVRKRVPASDFLAFSSSLLQQVESPFVDEVAFYDVDASSVYDGYMRGDEGARLGALTNQLFPPGAHDDVRSTDLIDEISKQQRTMIFLYNFTRRPLTR
jgi:hypothetical protein